jgi:putative endopeptidase
MKNIFKIFILLTVFVLTFISLNVQAQVDLNKYRGVNLENFDLTVKPNEDFFQYTNGTWLKNNPCPPEFSRWGSFIILGEENNKILRIILEEAVANLNNPKDINWRKIGDLYSLYMDTTSIENLGISPIKFLIEKIDGLKNNEDVIKLIAYFHSHGLGGFFGFYAGTDAKNSEQIIPQIGQGGLGLPERDYYFKDDEKSKSIRGKYVTYAGNMFKLMGFDEQSAKANADIIMKLETRLAGASMTRVAMRNPEATYHKMTFDELKNLTPGFPWDLYFTELGLADKEKFANGINIGQPDFFKEAEKMFTDVSIDEWKVYLKWNLIRRTADLLSSPFVNEEFNFSGVVLSGVKQQQPRWKKGVGLINRYLGDVLGQVFVEKMFPPKAKERALKMVNIIRLTLKERILQLSWMSDATKQQALKKLEMFTVKIGYPDKWKDYSKLEITRTNLIENMINAGNFNFSRNIDKIGKPVDKTEWMMTPQTVNAYYSPSRNEIVFPAAILQPPFFDVEADDALNYGGIGSVIGHEITHGFDDGGRKFDGNGNMTDWWTPEDTTKYIALTKIIEEQFNNYTINDTVHINGKLTLGENIADLGGLTIAYYALMKAIYGKDLPLIDGFTPAQRFFISWSQVWRINQTSQAALLQVNTDPHSPGRFRVLGPLANMDEFMQAFNCKEGDKMMRSKEQRVKIW